MVYLYTYKWYIYLFLPIFGRTNNLFIFMKGPTLTSTNPTVAWWGGLPKVLPLLFLSLIEMES